MRHAFAMRQDDESWAPCDAELNEWLDRTLAARGGQPLTMIHFNEDGQTDVISGGAYHILSLALQAMDARLRPERGYREKADQIYTILAGGFEEALQELRRVFKLGAQGPFKVP